MARNQQFWSNETRKARAAVDALREVLGYEPLYNQKEVPQHTWLGDIRDSYYETKPARTGARGSQL